MPCMKLCMCMACWLPSKPLPSLIYRGYNDLITEVHIIPSKRERPAVRTLQRSWTGESAGLKSKIRMSRPQWLLLLPLVWCVPIYALAVALDFPRRALCQRHLAVLTVQRAMCCALDAFRLQGCILPKNITASSDTR